ncbi:hypothetical protein KC207_14445 [Phycicoccus sp. BSK3Z-2]|uniref:ABC transporter permease n=1 Tax=Phycicoccus avicenniae TaxID=2828860 RepID=A0A941DDT8_9MICO|nr:hypothetical protein [Phycicoccus avicenniae]MBR7744492.1 hypothetical protein [Phycicoccus avicenniae]
MTTGSTLARTVRAEWLRLWSVRSTWVLVTLLALFVAGLGAVAGWDAAGGGGFDAPSRTAWEDARFTMLFLLFGLVALACVATAADYGTGGIVPTLQWTPRRGVLLAARAVVVVGAAVLVAAVLLTVAAALVAVQVPGLAMPPGAGASTLGDAALVVGSGALLGVGLGFLTRSTAGSLVTAVGLLVVLPLVLGNLPYASLKAVAEHLPGAGAIFVVFGQGMSEDMTLASARVTLLAWGVGAVTLGGLRLLRSDAGR